MAVARWVRGFLYPSLDFVDGPEHEALHEANKAETLASAMTMGVPILGEPVFDHAEPSGDGVNTSLFYYVEVEIEL